MALGRSSIWPFDPNYEKEAGQRAYESVLSGSRSWLDSQQPSVPLSARSRRDALHLIVRIGSDPASWERHRIERDQLAIGMRSRSRASLAAGGSSATTSRATPIGRRPMPSTWNRSTVTRPPIKEA